MRVVEAITVNDQVAVTPPVLVHVSEIIAVNDQTGTKLPVILKIQEIVNVVDGVLVSPPVVLTIVENVNVHDSATTQKEIYLLVSEAITVNDRLYFPPATDVTFSHPVLRCDILISSRGGLKSSSSLNHNQKKSQPLPVARLWTTLLTSCISSCA